MCVGVGGWVCCLMNRYVTGDIAAIIGVCKKLNLLASIKGSPSPFVRKEGVLENFEDIFPLLFKSQMRAFDTLFLSVKSKLCILEVNTEFCWRNQVMNFWTSSGDVPDDSDDLFRMSYTLPRLPSLILIILPLSHTHFALA